MSDALVTTGSVNGHPETDWGVCCYNNIGAGGGAPIDDVLLSRAIVDTVVAPSTLTLSAGSLGTNAGKLTTGQKIILQQGVNDGVIATISTIGTVDGVVTIVVSEESLGNDTLAARLAIDGQGIYLMALKLLNYSGGDSLTILGPQPYVSGDPDATPIGEITVPDGYVLPSTWRNNGIVHCPTGLPHASCLNGEWTGTERDNPGQYPDGAKFYDSSPPEGFIHYVTVVDPMEFHAGESYCGTFTGEMAIFADCFFADKPDGTNSTYINGTMITDYRLYGPSICGSPHVRPRATNIVSENIKQGVEILGVTGDGSIEADTQAADALTLTNTTLNADGTDTTVTFGASDGTAKSGAVYVAGVGAGGAVTVGTITLGGSVVGVIGGVKS